VTDAPREQTDVLSEPPEGVLARRALGYGVTITLVFVIAGLSGVRRAGSMVYEAFSLFFTQFARIELAPLLLVAAFAVVLYLKVRNGPDRVTVAEPEPEYRPRVVLLIACATTLVALAGIRWLFRGFLMADDEYAMWFQALIFGAGKRVATVAPEWCSYRGPMAPTTVIGGRDCSWYVGIFPVHSLLQAPFIALGIGRLGVPLSAGVSVWLVAEIARKLWPDRPSRAYIAAILLATSTQVLFMSMTMYAMSTHLLITLIFLRFYISRNRWAQIAVPWIGALAIGVHSPLPHLFLVPPFLLRYARERRWAMFAYVVIAYAIIFAGWSIYLGYATNSSGLQVSNPTPQAYVSGYPTALKNIISLPPPTFLFGMTLQLALIVSWNNLLLVILVVAAMMRWKKLDTFSRDAALSILLTLLARTFTRNIQGEGWGYRMIYGQLGMFALLAACGFDELRSALGDLRARRALVLTAAAALVIQLPLRVWGVNKVMGPYRNGYEWMSSLPYDVVIYPSQSVAWGRQLVRNEPFLRNRPIIMDYPMMKSAQINGLEERKELKVKTITKKELRERGFPRGLIVFGSMIIEP
jgi:hypothetical protein